MDITLLNFHIHHTPLNKIKPLMGKSLSLVNYNQIEGTSVLPYNIQYFMLIQYRAILKQSYNLELPLKVTYK